MESLTTDDGFDWYNCTVPIPWFRYHDSAPQVHPQGPTTALAIRCYARRRVLRVTVSHEVPRPNPSSRAAALPRAQARGSRERSSLSGRLEEAKEVKTKKRKEA
ncbi:hypothetical protein MTO96_009029 [Rhipicephalus appendiculatus]